MEEKLRDGRYTCFGTLGQGTQGTTFDGVDAREGRPVAIKRFEVRGAKSWKDVELAEREARVLAQLRHPKLPAYVDHFEEGGSLYLVMERIEGENLAALRERGGVLGEDDVVRLLRDASEVLDYLHGRAPPVIHRNLKPGNVLRRPDGSYAFVDFGAVRDKLRPGGGSTVVGTFGYMAPEQFQGRASPGTDVYAVGATALTMLTGIEPEHLPHKGLAIDVESALGTRSGAKVHRPLIRVLTQMLNPNPDERPQRMAPLLAELDLSKSRRSGRPSRQDEALRGWDEQGKPKTRSARREADPWAHKAERYAERQARKARAWSGGRPHQPPWFLLVGVSLGLTIASLVVVLSLRVVVPIVLTLLSLLLGSRLRDAAKEVSRAGERAGEAIERARARVHRTLAPERGDPISRRVAAEGARVTADPAARVRVESQVDTQAEIDAEIEAALGEEHSLPRQRRR